MEMKGGFCFVIDGTACKGEARLIARLFNVYRGCVLLSFVNGSYVFVV
jgi:hypothetical protein